MNDKDQIALSIAVIEDSNLLRRAIVDGLTQAGFRVSGEAKDAQEAINLIQQNIFNLFIIDVVMPEVSGLEIAKQIHKALPNAKIIVMSSLNLENVVIEALASGAVDFIAKPFEIEDLIKSVRKVEQEINRES
jgi:DNA-binding response OmpR family regulator